MWKWSNYLHTNVPVTKQPLHINIDETSVKVEMDVRHGHVSGDAKKLEKGNSLRRRMSKSRQRTAYSYVAVLCDVEEVQRVLPQFIVVNGKQCTKAVYNALQERRPENIVLWRRSSAWLNVLAVCHVLRDIHKSLSALLSTYQVILSMDSCKTHINSKVWQACSRLGFLMYPIPPKTTGILQPLDIYVFAQLKQSLRHAYQTSCIDVSASSCTLGVSVLLLMEVIPKVLLSRCWRPAFEHLGHGGNQHDLSKRVLQSMNLTEAPCIAATFPTLADLAYCFPRGYDIDVESVFKGLVRINSRVPIVGAAPLLRSVGDASLRISDLGVAAVVPSEALPSVASSSASAGPACPVRSMSWRRLPSGHLVLPLPALPMAGRRPSGTTAAPKAAVAKRLKTSSATSGP